MTQAILNALHGACPYCRFHGIRRTSSENPWKNLLRVLYLSRRRYCPSCGVKWVRGHEYYGYESTHQGRAFIPTSERV